jgi:hypothetical protein
MSRLLAFVRWRGEKLCGRARPGADEWSPITIPSAARMSSCRRSASVSGEAGLLVLAVREHIVRSFHGRLRAEKQATQNLESRGVPADTSSDASMVASVNVRRRPVDARRH